MSAALMRANALAFPLADESVDLVVTSPPYFALRSYQDDGEHYDGQLGSEATPVDFLLGQWAVLDECWRTLKPGGSVWFNYGDKYAGSGGHNNSAISAKSTLKGNGHVGGGPKCKATRRSAPDRYNQASDVRAKSLMGLPWRFALGAVCPQLYRAPLEPSTCWHDDGPRCLTCPPRQFPQWIGRAEIVWSKPNGLPESVTDRVRRSHEQWFHLVKSPRYFAAVDEVREPHDPKSIERIAAGFNPTKRDAIETERNGMMRARGNGESVEGYTPNPLGKLPGSVWTVPSEPLQVPESIGVDHFAAFPQEWPRRLVLGWSPPNGVVLDPFGGTGTTAMVARALGRYGVHLDLSADYLRLARWRVFESGHADKSVNRTNGERKDAGRTDLTSAPYEPDSLFGGAA